jgi:UDP-glucose:glycoprotein glucosyltransferase
MGIQFFRSIDDSSIDVHDAKSRSEQTSAEFDESPVDSHPSTHSQQEPSEIGYKFAQIIMTSNDPIATLRDVSANALLLRNFAAQLPKNSSVYASLGESVKFSTPKHLEAMFVNGLPISSRELGIDILLDVISRESLIMKFFMQLGLTLDQALGILHSPIHERGIFRMDFRAAPIIYLNDIENDRRYKQWPADIRGGFQALTFGQLPMIRRNLYRVVLVVPPSNPAIIHAITLIRHNVPVRFGLMFHTRPGSLEDKAAAIFYFLKEKKGIKQATDFLIEVTRIGYVIFRIKTNRLSHV